jgi:transketolase
VPLVQASRAELEALARRIRKTIIRMIYEVQSGHPGGSLSCVEILTALYMKEMRFDPKEVDDPNRDRLVLSKGHASPTLYAVLAELGVISREELWTLRQLGTRLQGHPDMKHLPGVEMSTGPLGLGLSAGLGMALAARLNGLSYHTYVLLGDGELQEGIIWEAAMCAAKYKADNLTAVVDYNGIQLDGTIDEIMPLGDLAGKFQSFGWGTINVDGHDFTSLLDALGEARQHKGQPMVVIARTVKGKGVSFMEGKAAWHGQIISDREFQLAMGELNQD